MLKTSLFGQIWGGNHMSIMRAFPISVMFLLAACGGVDSSLDSDPDTQAPPDEGRSEAVLGRQTITGFTTWAETHDDTVASRCDLVTSMVSRGLPVPPEIYHDLEYSSISSECLYQLTFWKFSHYLPSVDSKAELMSVFWRLARQNHELSLAMLASLSNSGVIQLDSELEPQAFEAERQRRLMFSSLKSSALEARTAGDREAERVALLSLVNLGSGQAASDLALLEIDLAYEQAQTEANQLRDRLRALVRTVLSARQVGDTIAEFEALTQLAEMGVAEAAMDLAFSTTVETGVLTREAYHWYEVALQYGDARAGWSLGAFLLRAFANSEVVHTSSGELQDREILSRAIQVLADASGEGYDYPDSLLSAIREIRVDSPQDLDAEARVLFLTAQPVGLVLSSEGQLDSQAAQEMQLPSEAIMWYRLATFLGEPRASWGLGAFLARSFAADQVLDAPEGRLEGRSLLREAASSLAAAGTAGYEYPADLAEDILALGLNLDSDFDPNSLSFLSSAQPIGRLLDENSLLPTGFSGHQVGLQYNQVVHVDELRPGEFSLEFHAVSAGATGNLIAISSYEIWEVGVETQVVYTHDFEMGAAWLRPNYCTNWFDASGCSPDRLRVDLTNVRGQNGQLFLRLVGEGSASFTPVPIFGARQINPLESRVAIIHPTYTWQAYNSAFGGSLYINSRDEAYAISLNRPVDGRITTSHHNFRSSVAIYRQYARLGVQASNLTQEMISRDPAILSDFDLVTVVGHDEYWDDAIEAGLTNYLAAGGRALFLSGNTGWWTVDVLRGSIAVDKAADQRELDDPFFMGFDFGSTGLDLEHAGPRIEEITGSTYESGGYAVQYILPEEDIERRGIPADLVDRADDLYILDPSHGIFEGLALERGQQVCRDFSIVDHEVDGLPIINALVACPTQVAQF